MLKIKHFIEQSWLLIAAAFCFGLLIAVTNAALSPRILQNEKDKLNNLMAKLITDANSFDSISEDKMELTSVKGKPIEIVVKQAPDAVGNCVGCSFAA